MVNIKFAITADIHFERVLLEEDGFDNMVKYFVTTLKQNRPSIFFIAGDLTDSRNLRLETPETAKLTEFMQILLDTCKEINCEMVFLKGTPSHDGDIVKNLSFITDKYHNFTYVEDMKRMTIRGLDILFIPELYRPTYVEFNTELTNIVNPGNPVDVIVFHGMFDFAISAVRQIDSKHNLSRTVVMNSKEIGRLCKLAIGGHVHSFMSEGNIQYVGRFINERGHMADNDVYGIKIVEFQDSTYSIINITNPYRIIQEVVPVDLVKYEPEDEYIRRACRSFEGRNKDVIYYVNLNNSSEVKARFKRFKEIYKPLYMKRNMNTVVEVNNLVEFGKQIEIFSNDDMKKLIYDTYKQTYGEELDELYLKALELGDDWDDQ